MKYLFLIIFIIISYIELSLLMAGFLDWNLDHKRKTHFTRSCSNNFDKISNFYLMYKIGCKLGDNL